MSIFNSKKVWKFLIQIQLTKSNPKITRGVKVPCLMQIRVKRTLMKLHFIWSQYVDNRSWFLGNFHIKPYFNTQWPPPLHASAIPGWFGLVSCSMIICSQHTVLSESKVQSRFSDQALPRTTDTWWWNICWECFPNSPSINVTCTLKCSFLEQGQVMIMKLSSNSIPKTIVIWLIYYVS